MERSKKIIILSLIPVFLTIIFILYIVVPTVGRLNELNTELKQEKTAYDEDKSQLDELNNNKKLLMSIQKLKEKLGNFDVKVPSEDDLSILLIDLEKFAESFNVKVIALNSRPEIEKVLVDPNKKEEKSTNSVKKKPDPSPLYSISLEVSAVGYYQDILNFINTLENYERKIAISSVKVENYKEDKETPKPRVQMTINCEIYKFDAKSPENTKEEQS